MDGWTGLYNLRARKRLEELQDRPLLSFENPPPMKFEGLGLPTQPEEREEGGVVPGVGRFALDIANVRANQAPTDQTPTGETAGEPTEEKNPYAFWKTSMIGGKEGREGLPLDRAVALAGMLASSFAPQEWGGRMGAQIAQYAREGSKAHEEWEAQRKLFGIEKEKLGLKKEEIDIAKRLAEKPTELEVKTGLAPGKEQLLGYEKEVARAGQQPSETMILSGALGADVAKTYIANKEALKLAETPDFLRELYSNQNKAALLEADKYRQELIENPLNAVANRRLADAQAERMLSEKRRIDIEIEAVKGSVIGKLPRETQTLLSEIDKAYNQQIAFLEKQYTAPAGMGVIKSDKREYEKLSQLAEWTNKHAVAANAVVPQYPGTAANIEYFSNQVQRYLNELYKPIAERKIGWLGGGAKQKEDAEQRMIALMRQVVELHRKFPGTPSSFALARQYQDALGILEGQEER